MTVEQIQVIKDNAAETLADLNKIDGALSKEQFLLYGASLAALHDDTAEQITKNNEISFKAPQTFKVFGTLIENELENAETYLQLYKHTEDDAYKQLALHEESHVAFFLDKAKAMANNPEHLDKIKMWKIRYENIMNEIHHVVKM